ncbi:MAG: NAD(P)H-dependent oxidoreductase subunit E, partial [Burkholderiaceae bacterium]|nr:NAD(P)H-dependent oxidoreductase subunit E [Burkholderiaceae bacterium]
MNPYGAGQAVAQIPLATPDQMRERIRKTSRLKGRQADAPSLAQVRDLIGVPPAEGHPRELLIEYLHRINDHWRGLHERHLVALAREMRLPMAEVFEVASFYHHFEVLDDDAAAPALTVRVCEGLSCELAGARALLDRLPALLGRQVRVIAAPCIGRCESAPAVAVGQRVVLEASTDTVREALHPHSAGHPAGVAPHGAQPVHTGYASYRAAGGYALAAAVVNGEEDAEAVLAALDASGLRGLGGAGFPAGRKWRIVR